jgi:hypothetical protein
MSRRFFWALVVLGSLLEALAAATLSAAVFSEPLRASNLHYFGYTEVLGRPVSFDWHSQWPMLVAAAVFCTIGVATCLFAVRSTIVRSPR